MLAQGKKVLIQISCFIIFNEVFSINVSRRLFQEEIK